jgi:membrane protease YdiL (CAAX protease family)
MKKVNELSMELWRAGLWTTILTILFLLFNWTESTLAGLLISLPFFFILYYLFFSVGRKEITAELKDWIGTNVRKIIVLPVFLLFLYSFYLLLNGQNPLQGALALVPYLIVFPLLIFIARRNRVQKIDWMDFTAFVIFLLLATFIKVDPSGNLPFVGEEFDSVYRISIMVMAVYSFSIIRGLDDIGFFPVLNRRYLWTAIWVWAAFYLFVFIVGYYVNFIKIIGHDSINTELLRKIGITLLITYLHTGIFEELFFRGILQNMLSKRIGQANSWLIFWKWGLALSIPLAFLVGYTLKGGMQWFPALMVFLIFIAAFLIERAGKSNSGVYTALAITSAIFGLVHYHSGAIIYIGFACLAGWAYGYTYIKTKNVFYSALVHTLVNSSVVIFGLEFVK